MRLRRRAGSLLMGAAVLFLIGTNVQAAMLFVLTALLLGALVAGAIVPVWALKGLTATVSAPEEVRQGEETVVELTLRNEGRGVRWSVVAADEHLERAEVFVSSLGPGETMSLATVRSPARRGERATVQVQVRSSAPFGVAERRRHLPVAPVSTFVLPRVFPLGPLPFVEPVPTHEPAIHASPRRGHGPDFLGVREYRAGDQMRHVHWGLTARHGQVMVREFEEERTRRLAVVVDTERDAGEAWTPLDRACAVAASIAEAASAAGQGVRPIAAGPGDVEVLRRAEAPAIHRWLASLEPSGRPIATVLRSLAYEDLRGVETVVAIVSHVGERGGDRGRRGARRPPDRPRRGRARPDHARGGPHPARRGGHRDVRPGRGAGAVVGSGEGPGDRARHRGGIRVNVTWQRPSTPPEDSVAMRIVVAAAVEVGVLAVVLQGAVDGAAAIGALTLAPLGYLFSYRRRARPALLVKIALSLALLVALARFFRAVGGIRTVDQARVPLAGLFLWVQVLHAFDVPRRRDLAFSLVSSTTLIAVAGALALSGTVVWLVLVWAGLAGAWLWLSSHPRPGEVATPISTRRATRPRRPLLARSRSVTIAAVASLVLGVAVFSAIPRLPSQLVRTPPFSLGNGDLPAPPQGASSTANLGLPPAGADGVVDFAPDAYPGFSGAMDLRSRGALSDELAFRVRAEQAALWRADVFDTYDGRLWTASDHRQESIEADVYGRPSVPVGDHGESIGVRRLLQTFYLESNQPNVLFGAAHMREVFFPSGGLQADRYETVRAPILLEEGLVYSVMSELPVFDRRLLEGMGDPSTDGVRSLERYLQLPEELPARVGQLAREITADAETPYERALAVQSWLQANTVYDLGVPREPEGVDAVDHFLFETRRGFCEHIASAMAVLLRSAGVPTRIATGFGPGQRNPFTGYFEVLQSDAHAWVEVLMPGGLGWMTFDPTFGVPSVEPSWTSRLIGPELVAAIGRAVGEAVPEPVKRAVGAAARGIAGAARSLAAEWPIVLIALGVAAVGFVLLRRRRGGRGARGPTDDAGIAFEEVVAALGRLGHERGPSVTPREYLERVAADRDLEEGFREDVASVVRTFERARFAPPSARPGDQERRRVRATARAIRDRAGSGGSRAPR